MTHPPTARLRHGYSSLRPDDRVEAALAVHNAVARAGTPDAQTQRTPHHVAAVYYTVVDFHIEDADLSVDITDQAANRIKAEKLFLSQAQTPEYAHKRIQIGAGSFGWYAHTGYAEGWVRAAPQVGRYLTVTDENLEEAEMSREEFLARVATSVSVEDSTV